MKELRGKTAIISGAVSGIGLGIAKAFAQEGVNVALGYRRETDRDEAMEWFAQNGLDNVVPVYLDVGDPESWQKATAEAQAAFGKLHILVNNAGTTFAGTIDKATLDDWHWIMQVNFYGVVNGVNACTPLIRSHGEGGHIVNVTSMAAYLPAAEVGLYSASKFAARGLTAALRPTLEADGIGVSELAPGLTRSNIHLAAGKRPEEFGDTSFMPEADFVEAFGAMMSNGMDPDEVGRKAVEGIRENRPVIFSHPEFSEEFSEHCEQLSAAFPDEPVPPERLAIEARRKASDDGEGGGLIKSK